MVPTQFAHVYLAPNNGAIGGGEVMLLRIADSLRELGVALTIVAPTPSEVLDAAHERGHGTIGLPATSRLAWMGALRRWRRTRPEGVLWCNGLVPSAATAGQRARLVHLHQPPVGWHRLLAELSRWRAVAQVVPSNDMLRAAPRARVLPNWTATFQAAPPALELGAPVRVGFLGRLSIDKGVGVLADAVRMLHSRHPAGYRLVLGGEPLFVSDDAVAQLDAVLVDVAPITSRLGWVQAAAFFDAIDMLIVPSVAPESFGLVAAEAMGARVPLIVSDAGALPEVVGSAGHVVPAGDAVQLAELIDGLASGRVANNVDALHARWQAEYSPEAGRTHLRALVDDLHITRQG